MQKVIRIGSRRSRLSLWQANHVAELVKQHHPNVDVEIHEFNTRGDMNLSAPLPAIGGKGLFTEALESALRQGEIDCAVHSLKDLPVEIPAGLALVAVPKRGDHRDVLVSRSGATLAELPAGSCIGTGSLRRRAQLLAIRADIKIVGIRGNVPTRIDKLMVSDSEYDAIVLAAAGLNRLGVSAHISEVFDEAQMLCAAGQGALAVQCRADTQSPLFFAPLNDAATELAVTAERAFLGALEGGCSLPVGAFAQVEAGAFRLQGRVTAADGARQIDVTGEAHVDLSADNRIVAREFGARLADEALEMGAHEILDSVLSAISRGDTE